MTVTIYHNPRCSKSRQTLALLEERSVELEIVHYLETPLSADEIKAVLEKLEKSPREIMRKGEAPYKDLNLSEAAKTDAALIQAMVENPILMERPIVVSGAKAAIGRPPEAVLDIL